MSSPFIICASSSDTIDQTCTYSDTRLRCLLSITHVLFFCHTATKLDSMVDILLLLAKRWGSRHKIVGEICTFIQCGSRKYNENTVIRSMCITCNPFCFYSLCTWTFMKQIIK